MKNLKKKQIKEAQQVSKASKKFGLNLKGLSKKIIYVLIIFMFINIMSFEGKEKIIYVEDKNVFDTSLYVNNVKDTFKIQLYNEVSEYIHRMAPNSKLNSAYLVEKCLEYETDITFVLSQGLLESHFGTRGKAAETNSVWNVGTYDNGKILYTYKNPNQSIEPYLKLVNEKYLINVTEKGDTTYKDLYHLLEDKSYINYRGLRFASAKGYENALRQIMIRIKRETKIYFYQEIINLPDEKILAYFIPSFKNTINVTEDLYALKQNNDGNSNTIKGKI